MKKRAAIGDTKWRVEWCSKLAFYGDDPTGDVDRDNCTMSYRSFATQEEARSFAVEVWPQTHQTFGIVEVDLLEFVPYDIDDAETIPHVGFWEIVGETTAIFSGEWE